MKIASLVILALTACAGLALGLNPEPIDSDESAIKALLDRFEAAIAKDDIKAVESCLYRKGYLQVYDHKAGGIATATLANWTNNPDWFKSNESVTFDDRQLTIDRHIAFVRFLEVSKHHGGSVSKYRSLFILVKDQDRWFISVTAGREL